MNWKQCVSLGLCSVGAYKGEPVANQLSGVWVLNEKLTVDFPLSGQVNFTSNGTSFVLMWNSWTTALAYGTEDNDNAVHAYDISDNSWLSEAYRTVDFGTTPQTVSENFYNWLTANAVKQ